MPKFECFTLPDVGEGLTEADIVNWYVAVGDVVAVNQPIVEIETAKSLVELPSPWSGVVSELVAQVGATVPVGQPIIVIDTDPSGEAPAGGDAPGGEASVGGAPAGDAPVGEAPAAAPAAAEQAAEEQSTEQQTEAVLVGYGASTATPRRRTRRAAVASQAPAGAGQAPTGPAQASAQPGQAPVRSVQAPAAARPAAAAASLAGAGERGGVPVLAKPPVRKLAKDLGIDLTTVEPTGPGGIVTREDVLARAKAGEPQSLATYPGDDQPWLADGVVSSDGRRTHVPVRSVRKRTAQAMVESAFTAPHVTVFHTVDVTRSMELLEQLKADRAFADVRVTPLLLTAKALVLAVRRHPQVNASWDDEAQEIIYKHYVNLGLAAATPRGLVVPNIKDAHRLTLHELAVEIAKLTATAREGRTTPRDMSDGTITITNVGVFGIDSGTPILNPGESAILALGAIRQQPWVHDGEIKPRWVTQLALSFDHRLVDGELGARVLADVARVLEYPEMGLVWG